MPPSNLIDEVVIRPAVKSDIPLVEDSWARTYRYAPDRQCIPTSIFHEWHRPIRFQIRNNSETKIYIAADKPTDAILAYIIVQIPSKGELVLHWAYTRRYERRNNLFYKLLAHCLDQINDNAVLFYTHKTLFNNKLEELGFTYKSLRSYGYDK